MEAKQTLKAIELALQWLQNNLVDDEGRLALDDEFFQDFDQLMEKFMQTRELADALKE